MAKVNGTSLECLTQCCQFWENSLQNVDGTNKREALHFGKQVRCQSIFVINQIYCLYDRKKIFIHPINSVTYRQPVCPACFSDLLFHSRPCFMGQFHFSPRLVCFNQNCCSFWRVSKELPEMQEDSFHLCDILHLVTCTSARQGQPVADTVYIQQLTVKLLQSGSYSSLVACHDL